MMGKDIEKILIITWNYPPKVGGMEQLLYQLVQQIKPDIQVKILAPLNDEENHQDDPFVIRSSKKGLLGFFWFALKKGWQVLRNEKPDLVLGGSALVSPVVFLLSKIHRTPGAVYVHGLDLIYQNPIYQLTVRIILPGLDFLISNSNPTKAIAVKMGIPASRISVLNPGLFTSDYDLGEKREQIRNKFQLQGKRVILYTGRFARRKGVLEFIKYVYADIIKAIPDVFFCVVGDNPDASLSHSENLRAIVETEIQNQGLSKHVRLFGWVDRKTLLELYTACDLFILPAIPIQGDMEGFGIVLAEANAAGRPAVSTRVGGIPDAVEDGVTAILVEPNDWDGFATAVIKLLNNNQLREQMGEAGLERAKCKLDWDVIGKNFIEILQYQITPQ